MQKMQGAHNEPVDAADPGPSVEDVAALALETAPLVMRAIRRLMRAGREDDLTAPQFRALGYVGRHPDAPLNQVAEHLGLSNAATSRLVDTLVERGLVERAIAADDRRYRALRLTSAGEASQAETRARALRGLGEILAALTPAERATLAEALPLLRRLFAPDATDTSQ